jgi:hypothetical protein
LATSQNRQTCKSTLEAWYTGRVCSKCRLPVTRGSANRGFNGCHVVWLLIFFFTLVSNWIHYSYILGLARGLKLRLRLHAFIRRRRQGTFAKWREWLDTNLKQATFFFLSWYYSYCSLPRPYVIRIIKLFFLNNHFISS